MALLRCRWQRLAMASCWPETACDVLEAGGVDLYNWSAVREFAGEHGGSRCASWRPYWEARTVRSRLGPRQQAHCSSPAKKWSPGYQPLLVLPANWSKQPVPSQICIAELMPFRFSVTSRYASSSDNGSMIGVYSANICRICRGIAL